MEKFESESLACPEMQTSTCTAVAVYSEKTAYFLESYVPAAPSTNDTVEFSVWPELYEIDMDRSEEGRQRKLQEFNRYVADLQEDPHGYGGMYKIMLHQKETNTGMFMLVGNDDSNQKNPNS